jgi:hypothetical protein
MAYASEVEHPTMGSARSMRKQESRESIRESINVHVLLAYGTVRRVASWPAQARVDKMLRTCGERAFRT